jgi:hypothetical protein
MRIFTHTSFTVRVVAIAITTFAAIVLTKWALILAVGYLIFAVKGYFHIKNKESN